MSERATARVIIAYKPGDPSREKPFQIVKAWLESFGWPVTVAGAEPGVPYNCGWSKNMGVRAQPARPGEVLLLADADCVCPETQLRHALWLASQAPGAVWTGEQIQILDEGGMDNIADWRDAVASTRGARRDADATPQLLAISRAAFDQVGGYDQAYVGYGFEDYDFRRRCEALWPSRRVKGPIVHMWHQPDPEKVTPGHVFHANEQRYFGPAGAPWATA